MSKINRITIEKIEGATAFDFLRGEWRELFTVSNAAPFLSWEWLSTWFRWFGANREPFFLLARRENNLIGFLPLCRQEKKVLGLRLNRLGFVGEEVGGADYLDVIAEPHEKAKVLAAMFDYLKSESGFDLISLENLAGDSLTVAGLRNFTETNSPLRYGVSKTAVCPQINLSGGWENLLAKMYRAKEFKRKRRKLEKMADFEFRTITTAEEAAAAFERFINFHEKRWCGRGGSEVTSHPQLLNFHREVVVNMACAGLLRFEELWIEGECRASVYGLEKDGVFYLYNTGFDQEWAKLSPGFVLIGNSIQQAIERGVITYDFLRGDETYKFDWANDRTELVTVNLRRQTAATLTDEGLNRIWRNLKNFSNYALPNDFAERLKGIKRSRKRKNQLAGLEVKPISKTV